MSDKVKKLRAKSVIGQRLATFTEDECAVLAKLLRPTEFGPAPEGFYDYLEAEAGEWANNVGGVFIPYEYRDYLWGLIEIERYRLHQDLMGIALSDDTHDESSEYIKEQLLNLNGLRLCFGGAE